MIDMAIQLDSIAYFRGEFRRLSECNINVATHALQYGTMVFGGIRGYYNGRQQQLYLFRLSDHYRRLTRSARIMQMRPPLDQQQMVDATLELSRQNNFRSNTYFRPFLYKNALQLSPRLHDVSDEFCIYTIPLDDYLDTTGGLRAAVSSWRRIDDNIIPTRSKSGGGYINSALAKSEAIQNGFDEAIFLDSRGFVSEGSAENIFVVRDNVLITPPLSAAILEGITRRSILEMASDLGIATMERDIARSELYIADEAFFCGTGAQVAWISEIDRRPIGDGAIGPISRQIRDLFQAAVLGEEERYSRWLTPVY